MAEYIERERLKEAFNADLQTLQSLDEHTMNLILMDIDEAPTADVVPVVHARWEECDYLEPCVHGFGTIRHYNAGVKCTNCVNVFNKKLLWKNNFCPNCGAKMNEGKREG